MFIALAMIIDRRRTLFKDIMYEREVHEAMNTKLKKKSQLILCILSPTKYFLDELKGEQLIIVLQLSVHSPCTSCSYMISLKMFVFDQ